MNGRSHQFRLPGDFLWRQGVSLADQAEAALLSCYVTDLEASVCYSRAHLHYRGLLNIHFLSTTSKLPAYCDRNKLYTSLVKINFFFSSRITHSPLGYYLRKDHQHFKRLIKFATFFKCVLFLLLYPTLCPDIFITH